jgi:hypothetical protein
MACVFCNNPGVDVRFWALLRRDPFRRDPVSAMDSPVSYIVDSRNHGR